MENLGNPALLGGRYNLKGGMGRGDGGWELAGQDAGRGLARAPLFAGAGPGSFSSCVLLGGMDGAAVMWVPEPRLASGIPVLRKTWESPPSWAENRV